jgi:cytochrome c oxidase subunit III
MDNSASTISESQVKKEIVNKNMLYIGIFSILMLFAGLTSAYIVAQADGRWIEFELPFMFWISTGVILISSATMNWALISVKTNNFKNLRLALLISILLGLTFCVTQFLGWRELLSAGIFFAGKTSNPGGSFIYLLSGMHLLHILSGLIYLGVIYSKSRINAYSSNRYGGVRNAALYWHFLDALWIYLFVFLYFM